MKYILVSLLICPLTMMAMEQQPTAPDNNEPKYVGILTHSICETTFNGEPYIFAYEEDKIVYKYNEQKNNFDFISRNMQNYIQPDPTNTIKTLPDELSSLKFKLSKVAISTSDQGLSAAFDATLTTFNEEGRTVSKPSVDNAVLKKGMVLRITPTASNGSSIPASYPIFQPRDSKLYYSPGATCKALELLPQKKDVFFSINETTDRSLINTLCRAPGSHAFAVVVAFLELQKQNNEYTPIPSEDSTVVEASKQ
jgi:hypothetical protein